DIIVSITLRNMGVNTVSTVNIEWTDGEDTYTEEFSNLDLSTLEEVELTLDSVLNYSSSGQREITVTAIDVNGEDDDNPDDNEVSDIIFVYSDGVEQKIVIEEGTGTWCGWCPRGFVAMDKMYDNPDQFPNFIGIGVHNGDPMTVPEYDNGLGLTGFPGSKINRVLQDVEVDFSEWAQAYAQLEDNIKPFDVSLEVDYDKPERFATINVDAKFFIGLEDADIRLSIVVIEDGVTGTGVGWGQRNFYAGGAAGPMDGWENLPDPVTDFEYDRVARALIGGFNGESGSIPTEIEEGETYSYEFTYTHPEGMNPQKMSFVALLIDQETGEILNAAEEPIPYELGLDKNIVDNFKLYPNPASDVVNATFNET
ncbi:MAG TPA: Omp28-related outer membrane protein, partial [Tissierellaceae bacterium]|nr:Omp28-related outer membrane protein [Tissierellaceae bacterium]